MAPPKAGLDFAAVRLRRGYLVVSADPITGVSEDIGRYAMKVSANDIATSGNRPQFAVSVILLPERSSVADVREVAKQMHESAAESGITIVGGHTEVTPGLKNPIVTVTAFSIVDRFVTAGDAEDGDVILMTKTAGLEGTSELARERRLSRVLPASILKEARDLIKQIDVSGEAVTAFDTGRVHAMHDCTEGGVLGAVFEMSLASDLGFTLDEGAVPVARVTRTICRELSIDPLRLIGSGSLLIAVPRGGQEEVEKALKGRCRVTQIGEFTKGGRSILTKAGAERLVKEAPEDELWRVLPRASRGRNRL